MLKRLLNSWKEERRAKELSKTLELFYDQHTIIWNEAIEAVANLVEKTDPWRAGEIRELRK